MRMHTFREQGEVKGFMIQIKMLWQAERFLTASRPDFY